MNKDYINNPSDYDGDVLDLFGSKKRKAAKKAAQTQVQVAPPEQGNDLRPGDTNPPPRVIAPTKKSIRLDRKAARVQNIKNRGLNTQSKAQSRVLLAEKGQNLNSGLGNILGAASNVIGSVTGSGNNAPLGQIAEVVKTATDVFTGDDGTNRKTKDGTYSDSSETDYEQELRPNKQQPTEKKKDKTLIYVIAGLAVLALIYFVTKKKK